MDDLFLALWRRYVDDNIMRQVQALASPQPLRAMWEYSNHVPDTSLSLEFMALARHRKPIKNELAETGERFRKFQADVFSRHIERNGLDQTIGSPDLLAFLITGMASAVVMEMGLGISRGHTELADFVERWLTQLEGAPLPKRQTK